ncbi:hypothetical protein BDF20DRAFT_833583 [Mycotypha africana]|uniref:uncharacterized protein n=1 Tax=Mycotypha africana TaxID=64632 RepID=UPI002301609B|nr:uncharacterized protein BDF20DRAFT_833583 [Mycotypha africana]KAI8984041.1 hypothetical protein BDF20DRAFT_833583 [Mycotypha africana]
MSQMSQSPQEKDMSDMVQRMKTRLALANFKLEHGIGDVDLRTLESSLYEHKFGTKEGSDSSSRSNTKMNSNNDRASSTISPRLSSTYPDKKKHKLLSHHRFYPTSPPLQHNDMDRLIKKNASRSSPATAAVPLSETRSQYYYRRDYYPYSQQQLHPFINSSRHYYSNVHSNNNNSSTNKANSSTRKLSATLSSDDEDAAHLLVLMHQSPTMSS